MYIANHLVAIVSCDGTLNTVAVLASRSGTSHDQLCIGSDMDAVESDSPAWVLLTFIPLTPVTAFLRAAHISSQG
jgi:hypothetical protein